METNEQLSVAQVLAFLEEGDIEERKRMAAQYPLLITAKLKDLAEAAFALIEASVLEQAIALRPKQKKEQETKKHSPASLPKMDAAYFTQFEGLGERIQASGGGKRPLKTQPIIVKDEQGNVLEVKKPQGRPPRNVEPIVVIVPAKIEEEEPPVVPVTKKVTIRKPVEELPEEKKKLPQEILEPVFASSAAEKKVEALEYIPDSQETTDDWADFFK